MVTIIIMGTWGTSNGDAVSAATVTLGIAVVDGIRASRGWGPPVDSVKRCRTEKWLNSMVYGRYFTNYS